MKKYMIIVLIAGMAILFFACSDSENDSDSSSSSVPTDDDSTSSDDAADDAHGDDTGESDGYPESCADGPVFTFDLASFPLVVPYPNDLYTVADASTPTGLRVNVDTNTAAPVGKIAGAFAWWVEANNTLDGFSTLAYLYIPAGEAPLLRTFPDRMNPRITDSIFLVNIDQNSPYYGEAVPIEVGWRPNSIRLQPWRPMREATHYAVVATRLLKPSGSKCYRASESIRRIYLEYKSGTMSEDTTRYESVLDALVELGFDPATMLSVSDFTTLTATKGMDDARRLLDGLAENDPPQMYDWTLDPAGDSRLVGWGRAYISTPILKNAVTRAWKYDDNGDLTVDHWEEIHAIFSLPTMDAHGSGQPYPLVLHGHGIFSSKEEMKHYAGDFAEHGFAVAAIDAICHNERYTDPGDEIGEGICFFDLLHPLGFRDNWRETAANYMWFARALKQLGELDQDDNGVPDYDVTHIYYVGHSFGTIMGGMMTAVEENIDGWVMHSAGADFISLSLDGPVVGPYFDIIELLTWFLPKVKVSDLVYDAGVLAQHTLDQADPANFLIHTSEDQLPVLAGRDFYMYQLGAVDDYTLGGRSAGFYCRAGGWPELMPYLRDIGAVHLPVPHVGSGYFQFGGDEHNGMFEDTDLGEAIRQSAAHYLETFYETGEPEIIDTFSSLNL